MTLTCLGRWTLKGRKGETPLEVIIFENTKKNCQMQAFEVRDAGNDNLAMSGLSRGRSWSHQKPVLLLHLL